MEPMRDLLKKSLGQSLNALSDDDKLAAAWPVACGKTMADRAPVIGFDRGVLRVEVKNRAWLHQLMSMREQLAREMARITGVRVSDIHFEIKR